jgi:cell division protein FtsI/penicillin-binding protein 2
MNTSIKAKKVLGLFLLAFLAIILRVWHLQVIQKEEKLLQAQKPQQRTILTHADRGTIYDRFGVPLAINRISYNATIYYNQIAQIPSISWKSTQEGKQIKVYARKNYIRELSQILAKTLNLDAERVEDLIHSKSALFPHVPFILKAALSEEEHYRLRMLEKDWPGIYAEISSNRFYPLGKTGCNLIGHLGSISQKEYASIAQQMKELQMAADLLELSDGERLAELKEKAYAINDLVGKTGIEAECEKELRGFYGKTIFEVDQKGRFVREIACKEPIGGKKVVLSISSELQQFAEGLLAEDEKTREGRSAWQDPVDKMRKVQKQPWIKGGAIVALDPNTGEVLALASHPRFDPNDFISPGNSLFKEGKNRQINRWLENDRFIGAVWDGNETLTRERSRLLLEENQILDWELTLDLILPKEGPLRTFFTQFNTVFQAIQLQEDYETMLYFTKASLPVPIDVQKRLDAIPLTAQDKLFAVDLCRTVVYAPSFTNELIAKIGSMKLSTYRSLCQAYQRLELEAKTKAQEEFHHTQFRSWKEAHQKEFLSEKRKIEKENKSYPRPYIDYLDSKEKELFEAFWEEKKFSLLASREMPEELIRTFRSFSQLTRPLLGKYKTLRNKNKIQTEKDLAASFYPMEGFGFTRSFAFETAVPQGSIFKLVTAYEGLRQNKHLTLIDTTSQNGVAYTLNNTLYPRFYKGGRLPRSASRSIGKIDLIGALEQSSNPYFSILAGDYFASPEDLANAAKLFGFGKETGIELPRENKGKVPKDLSTNRTGLYSTAIGQHTLLTTPLQTATMISAICNGGKLFKPKLIKEIVGLKPNRHPLSAFAADTYLAKEELEAIGICFPLFTGAQLPEILPSSTKSSSELKALVPMESHIRATLLEGMDRVVWGAKGGARPSMIKALLSNPLQMRDYLALQHQMIGKTGTAEIVCNLSKNPSSLPQVYKYIWFGAASFTDQHHEHPELVVVVFLRYGDAGKEAAPLAAQMIHKYREIKKKYGEVTKF